MYSETVFNALLKLVFELEEDTAGENDAAIWKSIEDDLPENDDRAAFYKALRIILAGFLTSDAETQSFVWMAGVSSGVITKDLIELAVAEKGKR